MKCESCFVPVRVILSVPGGGNYIPEWTSERLRVRETSLTYIFYLQLAVPWRVRCQSETDCTTAIRPSSVIATLIEAHLWIFTETNSRCSSQEVMTPQKLYLHPTQTCAEKIKWEDGFKQREGEVLHTHSHLPTSAGRRTPYDVNVVYG